MASRCLAEASGLAAESHGSLAETTHRRGPRVIEHQVDAVVCREGSQNWRGQWRAQGCAFLRFHQRRSRQEGELFDPGDLSFLVLPLIQEYQDAVSRLVGAPAR